MRLFVAIVPPPSAMTELDRRAGAVAAAWPGLRWTGPEAWHVTLAFLGEVTEQALPELGTRLERAARRHQAQDMAVRGAGAFPVARRANVVWAGIAADGAALRALAASVGAGARRAGAPPPDEGRRYRPHITLARLREPADVRDLTGELADLSGSSWTAGHIHLIRSHPPAAGPGSRPAYEDLARWPLRPVPPRSTDSGAG